MSSLSRAEVFRIKELKLHPNADTLEIVDVFGFPSIVRKGDYKIGDLAIFVPPDMIVSEEPEFSFLPKKHIKTIKLRGFVSYGLVVKARPNHTEGEDVSEEMGVKPYVKPIDIRQQLEVSSGPEGQVKYTDIESLRRYYHLLVPGEEVVIREKIHGQNFRAVYQNNKLHIGGHNQWLKEGENAYWKAANKYDIEEKLSNYPNHIFFGEIYGWIQDLRYGADKGQYFLAIFDIFNIKDGKHLDEDDFATLCNKLELPQIPAIYRGPWLGFEEMKYLAEGQSNLADHIREGFVIKPTKERFDPQIGRVILKLHGNDYLNRR